MEKVNSIIEAIAQDKNISLSNAKEAFKNALVNTAKRLVSRNAYFEIVEDGDKIHVYRVLKVVDDDSILLTDDKEGDKYISLSEAQEFGDVEIGDALRDEFVMEEYGSVGASNFYKELEYHLQRKIEQELFDGYVNKVGSVVFGQVTRVDMDENTYVEIGELRGILTMKNRIKGEKFKQGDTLKALLKYVKVDKGTGMFLELTRTAPKFLEELLTREVPEIEDGIVEIMGSARIPGDRAKVALRTDRPNIDPVGATVGQGGVRINAVSQELNGENIDCIEYSPIPEIFISKALSPAIVKGVRVVSNTDKNKKAIIDITADQKAKAIGKSGVNIRLASMLTKFELELNEIEGIAPVSQNNNQEVEKTTDTSALENLFN